MGSGGGVGQVRRGSSRGAWQEQAEWRYDFSEKSPAIVLDVSDGKHVKSLWIRERGDAGVVAELIGANGDAMPLTVAVDGKTTVFSAEKGVESPFRLTLTNLNEKRSLLLIEAKSRTGTVFRRLGEVGYTREGTRLAESGANGPECIVTGGLGTMQVSHKGKSYYVCCTGCKQAFEADPEAIIAAAAVRRAKDSSNE